MKDSIEKFYHLYTNKEHNRGIHTTEFFIVLLFTILSFIRWESVSICADAVVIIAYIFSRTHFKKHFGKTEINHITYGK